MDIAAFGEQLVKELGLARESSTLARWMAHYIAERIALAQNARGAEKASLQRECYDAILKLWKHRRFLPSKRPLESFEPILEVLGTLDDENGYWNFDPNKITNKDDVGDWLRLAVKIDQGSKTIISWCITLAAFHARNSESKWIEGANLYDFDDIKDLKIIRLLADRAHRLERATGKSQKEQRREELKKTAERLNALEIAGRLIQVRISKFLKQTALNAPRKKRR